MMHTEYSDTSVKHLLKQVYAAHVNKVKGLEDEIHDLKNQLLEANRKSKESECKKCAELEEAFKNCKSVLHEQTKWFENLGQKFSVFNNSENKTLSDVAEHKEKITLDPLKNVTAAKLDVKQNLFQNLLSLNPKENQDTLDLCSIPLASDFSRDYSTLNVDTVVLAPDTIDIIDNVKSSNAHTKEDKWGSEQIKGINKIVNACKTFNETNACSSEKENNYGISKAAKRPHMESSDPEKVVKKMNTENSCLQEVMSKLSPKHEEQTMNSHKSDNLLSKIKECETELDAGATKSVKIHAQSSDVEICKDVDIASHIDFPKGKSLKKSHNMEEHTNIGITNTFLHVSPSLLPLNKNSDTISSKEQIRTEDDDFQPSAINKKPLESDGAWTACDKKKLKKELKLKSLKSTSKFKMQLDSLPPNYKKPTYRQTKLSKTLFQPKICNSADNDASACTENTEKSPDDRYSNLPPSAEADVHVLSPIQNIKVTTVDFDATCIPDNYEYEIIPSGNGKRGSTSNSKVRKSFDDSIELIDTESPDESLHASPCGSLERKKILKTTRVPPLNLEKKGLFEDFISRSKDNVGNENLSSFDRLPKKEEPCYKYKEETVRKRAERKQLIGFDCKECENYYSDLGLSDKEKQERLKKCSRHRAKFAPPPTPEHFWELEFPDTQECKARGYLNETQKVKLKSHRRRPLDL